MSDAPNLIPGQVDTNDWYDVFLYDRVANSTVLVSGANGSPTVTANSQHLYYQSLLFSGSGSPAISADGRYVTFTSTATNIIPGFVAAPDAPQNIFVYDRITANTKLVSHRHDSLTASASMFSDWAFVSRNGEFITFRSQAVDLVSGFPNPGGGTTTTYPHAYVYDVATEKVTLLDHKFGSVNVPANYPGSVFGAMPGGRYILLQSYASDIWEHPTTNKLNLYLHDRQTGNNLLISKGTSGVEPFGGDGHSGGTAISVDGKWICVVSEATNLIPGATSSQLQVMLYDVDAGTMRLVSHAAGNPLIGGNGRTQNTQMSSDGRYIAFTSKASNLINGFVDGNSADYSDVYLYDRDTDQTTLVNHSLGSTTNSSNGSDPPYGRVCQISADGEYVLFWDKADDLVPGFVDRNGLNNYDTYLFDRMSGEVVLVSGKDNSATISGNDDSYYAMMSADGKYVAIASEAADLSSEVVDTNGLRDVYLRNLTTGATTIASRRFGIPSLSAGGEGFWINQTPDGRFVVFCDTANNLVPGQVEVTRNTSDVFLLDRATNTTVLVSHAAGSPTKEGNYDSGLPVISADGRYVAYASYATDLVVGFVDANGLATYATDVFVYDRLTGMNQLVSRQAGTTNVGGNDSSGSVFSGTAQISISGDGRWVCFQSHATDLMSGFIDNNGKGFYAAGADIFLFDRLTGNMLLPNHLPGQPVATGNGWSLYASISEDGRFVAYRGNSTNTVPGMTSGPSENTFLYDRIADTTVLVNHVTTSATTASNKGGGDPTISRDGNFIVYSSASTDLVDGGSDTNNGADVFLYDRQTGANTLVSHAFGSSTMAGSRRSNWSPNATYHLGRRISADGRYVVYESEAHDLVNGFVDGNQSEFDTDIYLFDRLSGTNVLVSRTATSGNKSGNYESWDPTISGDGRFVAFISGATDLVNGFIGTLPTVGYRPHLFVFDQLSGLTKLVSHDATNSLLGPLDDSPGSPSINADGSVIAYTNSSSALVAGDLNGFADIFAYITPPPRVTSIQISDGSVQRSLVTSFTVTFNDAVNFPSDLSAAFQLQRTGPGSPTNFVNLAFSQIGNVVTVTFDDPLYAPAPIKSLIDGTYKLTLVANNIQGAGGFLDGDNNGTPGGDLVLNTHRLFADGDGNGRVDSDDFALLRSVFGTSNGLYFDADNDGVVDFDDFNEFRKRFGINLLP